MTCRSECNLIHRVQSLHYICITIFVKITNKKTMQIYNVFSPPVRWGLLDFMSAYSSSSSSASASSSSSCDHVTAAWRAGPQPRSCEISVPRRTSTAILWDQRSAPDLNRDPVRSLFCAGPQPRSCEISAGPQPRFCEASVPRRTSTGKCIRKNVRR